MTAYIHPNALCESADVGEGTRVWAFAHILPGARIGRDCNICDGVFVENDVRVGDRTTVKCGVQLWDGVRLGDDVFVGPNATFTNDAFPRSRRPLETTPETVVENGASIGANATILPGIRIGTGAMVGAGAVVTRSVPANAVVFGNPARISAYTSDMHDTGNVEQISPESPEATTVPRIRVRGVQLRTLPSFYDIRGTVSVGDFQADLPFPPQRYFTVFDVPSQETRGEHAHRRCHQFLVCIHGSVRVLADDGASREEFVLDSPSIRLHIPPLVCGTQYRYSTDAVLLVFASEAYDSGEYIREYSEFLKLAGARQSLMAG